MQYFFDTSAVVKIYHEEDGSEIVLPFYNGNDNSIGKSNSLFSLDALQAAAFSIISDNTTIFVCADKKLTSFVKNIGYETLEL